MKTPIIILHGWGLSGSVYKDITNLLQKKGYSVFAPDMPGFGSEALVNEKMNLSDYVNFLNEFIEKKKLSKVILIAHSFGGRIAVKYVSLYPEKVSKLVLTGVPIIRHISLKKWVAYYLTVIGGSVFRTLPLPVHNLIRKSLYFMIGEWDYYNAGPRKQVFKNIIEEDLIAYARQIKIPVLLLWGKNDRLTPSKDVNLIKKLIPQAKSVIIENTGHKLPYEKPTYFFDAIESFL